MYALHYIVPTQNAVQHGIFIFYLSLSLLLLQYFFFPVNLNIDENIKDFVTSPLVLTTEVCNPGKCQAGKMEGVCISGESCFKHGGQTGNLCNGSSNLICCTCQYLEIVFQLHSRLFTVHTHLLCECMLRTPIHAYTQTQTVLFNFQTTRHDKLLFYYYNYLWCLFRSVVLTVLLTCGDVSSQKVTYLQSPENLKIDSGSVACDYDVLVQKDTCAVRYMI